MIHHPQNELIKKYSDGELSAQLASMVSAHLDVCEDCRLSNKEMLKNAVNNLDSKRVQVSEKELDHVFDLIMSKLDHGPLGVENEAEPEEFKINISGQVIHLPRSLNFLKGQQIPWKEFGTKNAIAPVVMNPQGNFYLIYIGPGESVPQHNHTGTEYSYVAAGSYHDGISSFTTGDFSVSNHEITHSPKATSEDGCLVLSRVEGRLNYFDGWLRPLNAILWWYLHRA